MLRDLYEHLLEWGVPTLMGPPASGPAAILAVAAAIWALTTPAERIRRKIIGVGIIVLAASILSAHVASPSVAPGHPTRTAVALPFRPQG